MGATCRTLGQKVKGQPSGEFLGSLIFGKDICTHLGQFFFLLSTQIQDDERNMPRKFYLFIYIFILVFIYIFLLIEVSQGRSPKPLDDFADFSVLYQVGRFTFWFCYKFLVIFLCLGIFPFDRTRFFTFIIPGSRDIVQVVQTVHIDLQKLRFTAPGSNLAFVLKNLAHNFYKMQKGQVIAFYEMK